MSVSRAAKLLLATAALAAKQPARAEAHAAAPDASAQAGTIVEVPRAGSGMARFAPIVQVTRDGAYLDAGRDDGVAVGASLTLWRLGRHVGACEVTAVSDHHASCNAARVHPGDLARLPDPPPRPTPKLPGPRDSPEQRARLRDAVMIAEIPKVPYRGPRDPAPALPARVEVAAYASGATRAGSDFVERLDLSGRGRISSTSELAVRVSGERWNSTSARPFRPGEPWQLYVWEARVTRFGSPADVTLGRFLPGGPPGQPIIDGAQLTRRLSESGMAVGIYAGAAPLAVTTEPSLRSPTAGVQLTSPRVRAGGLDVGGQGRIGIVGAAERSPRAVAELSGEAGSRRFDLIASARLGAGGSTGARLDAARVDLSARPWEALVVSAGFRSFAGSPEGTPGFGPVPAATRRGDVDARWTVAPWLWVGAEAAAERDLGSRLERATFGPSAGATNLLHGLAGWRASWLEERGWWPGRTFDLAGWFKPSPRWRVSGTVALSRWSRADDAQDFELWGSASVMAALLRWVDVRATVSGNAAGFAAPAAPYRGAGGGLAGWVWLDARR